MDNYRNTKICNAYLNISQLKTYGRCSKFIISMFIEILLLTYPLGSLWSIRQYTSFSSFLCLWPYIVLHASLTTPSLVSLFLLLFAMFPLACPSFFSLLEPKSLLPLCFPLLICAQYMTIFSSLYCLLFFPFLFFLVVLC